MSNNRCSARLSVQRTMNSWFVMRLAIVRSLWTLALTSSAARGVAWNEVCSRETRLSLSLHCNIPDSWPDGDDLISVVNHSRAARSTALDSALSGAFLLASLLFTSSTISDLDESLKRLTSAMVDTISSDVIGWRSLESLSASASLSLIYCKRQLYLCFRRGTPSP